MWAMGESISSLKRIIYVTARSGAKLSWKRNQECEYKQESRSQYPILPYLEAVKQPRFQRVKEEKVDGTRYSVEKHEALQLYTYTAVIR